MDFADFKKEVMSHPEFHSEFLDEAVDDILSREATEINNNGIDYQLTFLLNKMTQQTFIAHLNSVGKTKL